jgi:branched-chain amino acid transport system permease protein
LKFWVVRFGSILAAIAGAFLIEFVARQTLDDYSRRLVVLAAIYVTLAVSLNLINGITGQFSIGHAAFYMVGAYTSGFLTNTFIQQANLPPLLWLILVCIGGALGASIAGFLVGLPSLRLRGDYLAIVTLAFGEIVRIFVQNSDWLGGSYGMNVPFNENYIWLVWLLAFTTIACSRNLLQSARGLTFLAVRENEVAAQAMGVPITAVKVTAFVVGSAFAGAAGGMLAHYESFITPMTFAMDQSFIILTMVVLGGSGSITGATLAAIVLFALPEQLRNLPPVSGATLAAVFIALIAAVALTKKTESQESLSKPERRKRYAIYWIGGILAGILLAYALSIIPIMRETTFEAGKLRMLIFAVTLIVLMMLRPQGVMAHHEFSWAWLRKVLKIQKLQQRESEP